MKRYLTLAVFIILLILIFAAKRERSTWKQADTLRNGGSMTISVSKIKPNPNNPRLIKDDKFKKLVQSIKDFPDMLNKRPIVVNKDMIVLGGNMRLKACIEAGMKEVPVIVADWSEEQQREFIIKDNVSGGEWDWDVLANEWDANKLTEWGLDVPDIQQLDAEEDDFDVPEGGIETDIVLGDLFEIGEHRLLCGDSTDSDAVGRLMNGQKADMVFTDPPYNINYGNIKHPKFKQREIENDNMSGEDFETFCTGFISNIVLFNKGCVYMAGPPGHDGRIMFMAADKALHCSTVIGIKTNLLSEGVNIRINTSPFGLGGLITAQRFMVTAHRQTCGTYRGPRSQKNTQQ